MGDALNDQKKRILITGATGFIGGYLVREAHRQGYEIWAAVRKHSDRSGLNYPHLHTLELDYHNPQSITQMANELAWHYVIHNAGITKAINPADFERVNASQTATLLQALQASHTPPERFLLMSSMGSYGPPPNDQEPLSSVHPQHPTNYYGKSKLHAEQIVRAGTLPYTIIQPTGVYGPGDKDYLMSIRAINKGIDFITGPKPQLLSFVHAADVATATFLLMTRPEAVAQCYIVSDGEQYTDIEYGCMVQQLLGRKYVWHLRCPLWIVRLACQLGEWWNRLTGRLVPLNKDKYAILRQRNWLCDITPLKHLGYQPRYRLHEGLRHTIEEARQKGLL